MTDDDSQYSIFEVSGKLIKSGNTTNDEWIDISDLSNGMYFIKVRTGNTSSTTRLIKQ